MQTMSWKYGKAERRIWAVHGKLDSLGGRVTQWHRSDTSLSIQPHNIDCTRGKNISSRPVRKMIIRLKFPRLSSIAQYMRRNAKVRPTPAARWCLYRPLIPQKSPLYDIQHKLNHRWINYRLLHKQSIDPTTICTLGPKLDLLPRSAQPAPMLTANSHNNAHSFHLLAF
jgi:hypothetical protein